MSCIQGFQWLTAQTACTYPYLDVMKCSIMTLYTYELHITMCLKCISPSRGTMGQHSCRVGQLNWQLSKLTIFMSHLFKTQTIRYKAMLIQSILSFNLWSE